MMQHVVSTKRLSHAGAMKILSEAVAIAERLGKPLVITVVDASGVLLAACRMDGSFFLAIESSLNKATTAAATGKLTGQANESISTKLGLATFGRQTVGLMGGVPIIVDGQVIGGIGAGSATGEEDRDICIEALKVLPGATTEF
jgi:glc operon protein GlcG